MGISHVDFRDANNNDELLKSVYPESDEFEVSFNDIVDIDRVIGLYAIVTFSSGSYTKQTAVLNFVCNGTKKITFDSSTVSVVTGDSQNISCYLDLNGYGLTINSASVPTFIVKYKASADSVWTTVSSPSVSYVDNKYTVSFTLPTPADEIYYVTVEYVDFQNAHGIVVSKVYNKGVFLGVNSEDSLLINATDILIL